MGGGFNCYHLMSLFFPPFFQWFGLISLPLRGSFSFETSSILYFQYLSTTLFPIEYLLQFIWLKTFWIFFFCVGYFILYSSVFITVLRLHCAFLHGLLTLVFSLFFVECLNCFLMLKTPAYHANADICRFILWYFWCFCFRLPGSHISSAPHFLKPVTVPFLFVSISPRWGWWLFS